MELIKKKIIMRLNEKNNNLEIYENYSYEKLKKKVSLNENINK